MPNLPYRVFLERALRAPWAALQTLVGLPARDTGCPLGVASERPSQESSWDAGAPESAVVPSAAEKGAEPNGVETSEVADPAKTRREPAEPPTMAPEAPPSDVATADQPVTAPPRAASAETPTTQELLTLIQARLDVISERLDWMRDQLVMGGAASQVVPARAPRRAGSLRREVGYLSRRLERLERESFERAGRYERFDGVERGERPKRAEGLGRFERDERRGGPPEEMPSRAALRPPRVPTDLFETNGGRSEPSAGWNLAADEAVMGPRLNGTFDDLRLATLLEILQQEGRVGTLMVRTPEHTLDLELSRGTVIGARIDGVETELVAAVREAFRWPNAAFEFRRTDVLRESSAPRSIHGLLLEVLRQNDEAARVG